jgi:hypothetical protein
MARYQYHVTVLGCGWLWLMSWFGAFKWLHFSCNPHTIFSFTVLFIITVVLSIELVVAELFSRGLHSLVE